MPRRIRAALCIRAGYLALRNIADVFDINIIQIVPSEPIQSLKTVQQYY
jgi:hypothetical protein